MIKFLFGKAGSGKSHVGEASRDYGFHFHDADADLPDDFRKAIGRGGGVTDAMREQYLAAIIATLRRLAPIHPKLCVSQALVRDRMRIRILEAVPSVEYVWVDAPEAVIQSRIERPGHIASRAYAEVVNSMFEAPTVPHAKFLNDNDAARFAEQMRAVFGTRPG